MRRVILISIFALSFFIVDLTATAAPASTHTVTYDGNGNTGGSVPTDSSNYIQGATAAVLGDSGSLVKRNFALAGWMTKIDGTGTSYAVGATFRMSPEAVTLYALWVPLSLKFSSSKKSIVITGYAVAPKGALTIPAGITSIGQYAFQNCKGLVSVIMPSSVTSIGMEAFFDCASLTMVTLSANVTSIGQCAFWNCTSLSDVTIPAGITRVADGVFRGCAGLTSITIPSGVTTIGSEAFSGCAGLTSVIIPGSVTGIGEGAFSKCTILSSVAIPSFVTSIGRFAFEGCTNLTRVTVDPANAYYESDNSGVLFTKGGTTLLQAPAKMSGDYVLPASVIHIGDFAFQECASLTSVTIPSSVTSIGENAFPGLASVLIPASVTSIGDGAVSGSFVTVDPANAYYESDSSGVLFTKDGATLIQVPTEMNGSYAVPASVTVIDQYAFGGCTGLTSVTIPASVTSIGYGNFANCRALTSVTIPASVTSIGEGAFNNCTRLTSVIVKATIPPTLPSGSYAFHFEASGFVIRVPAGIVAAYKAAAGWSDYVSKIVSQ